MTTTSLPSSNGPPNGNGPVVLQRRVELPNSGCEAIVLSLNRPDRLNCFNTDVCTQLSKFLRTIADNHDDNVVAVILTGEGRSFCAGADLANPPNPLTQSSDLPDDLAINPVYQMSTLGVPIIGAIQGHCVTGGFELALACDILVGDSTTKFRDTHVKFGLAPCWGLSQKLQRRVGPGRAQLISYTAMPVPAKTALDWGLLDDMVETDVVQRALDIADSIGKNDALMVRRYKRALQEGGSMALAEGLQRERQLGMAHYLQAVSDGATVENARDFITDEDRPRLQSKL